MTREIKFRAWDKEKKRMLYHDFVIIPTSPGWSATEYFVPKELEKQEWFDCAVFDWADGKMMSGEYIILQYTGLKDKNGKEIYEGDIVKTVRGGIPQIHPELVIFGKYGWLPWEYEVGDSYFRLGDVEVIGNIYENAKLLKRGEKRG